MQINSFIIILACLDYTRAMCPQTIIQVDKISIIRLLSLLAFGGEIDL